MTSCLVVDDSRVVRKVARRILEAIGFTVAEAEDGQQALDACRAGMPDCVLLDWNMPVMNGIDFLRALRAEFGPDNPPVVFCTTENDIVAHRTGDRERRPGIHHEAIRRGHPARQVRPGRSAVSRAPPAATSARAAAAPGARVMVCDDSAVIRGAHRRACWKAIPASASSPASATASWRSTNWRAHDGRRGGARHRDAGDGRADGAAAAAARRSGAEGGDGLAR